MEVLAWFVIIIFLLFGAGPVAAILISSDSFMTYPEAVGFGFVLMLGAISVLGAAATLYWAIGAVT